MSTLPLQTQPENQPLPEGVSTLYDVSWEQFKTIDALLDRHQGVKPSYLRGLLEITSPVGPEHESVKCTLGLLLEAYLREKGIRFYRCGGFTIESPKTASGTPDESYAIGSPKEIPDIVIEVIVSSDRLDKKELYRPKQVPEVWFWKQGEIIVFQLGEQGYEQRDRSQFFPALDLSVLIGYVNSPDQYDAVAELIQAVRRGEL